MTNDASTDRRDALKNTGYPELCPVYRSCDWTLSDYSIELGIEVTSSYLGGLKMTRSTTLIFAYALFVTTASAQVQNAAPTDSTNFQFPLIKGHGGIIAVPDASQQPKMDSKVLLDITSDEKSGGIIKGLDRAALILNQYTQAGAGTDNGFKMALVLHGPATKAALSHEAYKKHSKPYARSLGTDKNPNLKLLQELKNHGVEIFVCAQALAHHGYAGDEVAKPVRIAVSAATVNINKQMEGYAYIPFH
ncbi:DsrE/DsrF-like family protein [Gimesia maris]|uniref:DsrE family protein n=1 Tax=Gimesia maris TaxID=122 RepID=UPI001187C1EF|nr:DsrE family protein [Gimesia maris]QDU15070.1 DsrE/DsrF-like family protein [Gimesia maris]